MDQTFDSIQQLDVNNDTYVNRKIDELEKLHQEHQDFLLKIKKTSCLQRIRFKRQSKQYKNRRNKILKDLGLFVYNSSKSVKR